MSTPCANRMKAQHFVLAPGLEASAKACHLAPGGMTQCEPGPGDMTSQMAPQSFATELRKIFANLSVF